MKSRKAGVTVYLQEELSDARLRCDELKHLMVRALDMIHASKKSDHFYAVAGDIIYSVPEIMIKLEKALDAAAMAVNEMDNEAIKLSIRPEKVDELDRVLDEVRIRMPKRTGR
jgi:hypothetical protein